MEEKELKRQQIAIFLLAAIIFLSGYIVYSQKAEPTDYVPVSRENTSPVNQNLNTTENSKLNSSKTVNINTASIEDLDKLPGIGEKTAAKIIEHRKVNGPFKTKESIMDVSGIGDSKYAQIKDLISL